MRYLLVFILLPLLLVSCKSDQSDEFKKITKEMGGEKLAQVGDRILTENMLKAVIPEKEYLEMKPLNKRQMVDEWIAIQLIRLEAKNDSFPRDVKNRFQILMKEDADYAANYVKYKISLYKPSEEETKGYYMKRKDKFSIPEDAYRVMQIFYKTEAEAKNSIAKIKAGEDFSKIAKTAPDDKKAAENGGDQGLMDSAKLDDTYGKELSTKIKALSKGELLSEPAPILNGFLIIKLADFKKKGEMIPFEIIKPQIEKELISNYISKCEKELINKLVKKYKPINYLDNVGK
ncbi:MAG: peptidyl-prolyl cis-trans isomerase [Candidatus Coatesbacteria bacterium]|nr:peptidyl-prolyl cis-trans isomerase [Candidatus Coatesbacteria bacterium]